MDDAQLEKLKAANPNARLVVLSAGGHQVVVKKPDRTIWRRYRAAMTDSAKQADAHENLLRWCLVWPDGASLDAMLDEAPGLADSFGLSVLSLAGLSQEVEKKAL